MLFILESEDVSVALKHIINVLLKQTNKSELELLVPANSISVVLDGPIQFALFDVHGLHAVAGLFLAQLVVHDFLETHALVIQQSDEAVVVAAVADDVVASLPVVVKVKVMEDHVVGCAHFDL